MSSGAALDIVDAAAADYPALAKGLREGSVVEKPETYNSTPEELVGPNGERYPTAEDWSTLRRVYGKVNWMIYVIGIVEMCERFAYYGTTAVCMYIIVMSCNTCADSIKSSILFSRIFLLQAHSHLLVLRVRMAKLAL